MSEWANPNTVEAGDYRMKHLLSRLARAVAALVIAGALVGMVAYGSRPWYSRWGATDAELASTLPGDELVPNPTVTHMSAITIQAPPERIYPWLVQLGAERGGFYSLTLVEGLINCPITNAESIHPEWQDLKPGDLVKMCPGTFGPPPYTVASLEPNRGFVLGHQNSSGAWEESWQFALIPIDAQTTRLALRGRSLLSGGIWAVIEPGTFLMEQGLLNGVKNRAEQVTTGQDIRGHVWYGSEPVGGATVRLGTGGWKMSNDQVLASAVTDDSGAFNLPSPPLGDFIVVAAWPDGTASEAPVSRAQVFAGASLPEMNIYLAKQLDWLEPAESENIQATPILHWGGLEDVTQYRLQVIDAGTTELVLDRTTSTNSLSLMNSLKLGRTYDVVVNGTNANGVLLGSITHRFKVRSAP
jgi:hypothetical protein